MRKKILIIGGSGFLGQKCLEYLTDYDVVIVGKRSVYTGIKADRHEYHTLDICNGKSVEIFLNNHHFTHGLYLAWPLTPPHNGIEHIRFSEKSLNFLIQFSKKNPTARVVVTGSIHEVSSDSETLYGLSKSYVYDCMQVLLKNNFQKISFCWVRLSNLYGPADHTNKILGLLMTGALKNETVSLRHPERMVNFIHIQDAAQVLCQVLFSEMEGLIQMVARQVYRLKEIQLFIEQYVQNQDLGMLQKIQPMTVASHSEFDQNFKCPETISLEDGIIECIDYLSNTYEKN